MHTELQPQSTTLEPSQPTFPVLPTDLPLDSTNPLVWVIFLTALLSNTEKPLNATANLTRAIAELLTTISKGKRSK
jgi:hypothetical protein